MWLQWPFTLVQITNQLDRLLSQEHPCEGPFNLYPLDRSLWSNFISHESWFKSNFKATAWKELVLACIGEQFSSQCSENDEITGISVSIREREDLIQIWNSNSIEADRATVIEKIKNELLPEVQFSAVFYKGNLILCPVWVKSEFRSNISFGPN